MYNYLICLEEQDNCPTYYPVIDSLNYEYLTKTADGYDKKLTIGSREIVNLALNGRYEDLIATIYYLRAENDISKKLQNDLLLYVVKNDSSNSVAHYELAKLRYNEGYVGLSAYLIDRYLNHNPDDDIFIKIKEELQKEHGLDTYDKSITFEEYLEFNLHYIEE